MFINALIITYPYLIILMFILVHASLQSYRLFNNKRPGFVMPHFIGCCANSADHVEIVRRILGEQLWIAKLDSVAFGPWKQRVGGKEEKVEKTW